MSAPSTPVHMTSLASQLQTRLEQDRKQIVELTSGELEKLANDLQSKTKSELATTAEGIINTHKALRQRIALENKPTLVQATRIANSLRLSWIMPPLIALSLLLATSFGAWGLTQYLSQQIKSRLTTLERLEFAQTEAEKILARMAEEAWGLRFEENEQGRWIILPQGLSADSNWTIGDYQAIRLQAR